MSLGQLIACGKFTSDGSAKNIVLRSGIDFMNVLNYTQMATQQATGRGVKFEWQVGMADDAGIEYKKTNSTDAINGVVITSGGFTFKNTALQAPEAAKATSGTDIAKATSVVTVTSHGYSVGDRVRMYGTTSMLQIAGMEFTITAASTNAFTLGYIDMSGFAADATAGFARRIPNNPLYAPAVNWITAISAAANAVVQLSVTHGLEVDDMVRLNVPAGYGMVQADGLQAKVLSVDTATNEVTLDLDTSAFTAFAFPASGATPFTFATLNPFGDVSTNVDQALVNGSQLVMKMAAGAQSPAGSDGDVIYWQAYKAAVVNQEP